jgi:gamma-glutamyl-gamma-aminobutyraldehyde dehydrogenase
MCKENTMSLDLTRDAIDHAVANLRFRTQAFIDGRYVGAKSGRTFATENPANGQTLAEIAQCDTHDVDAAVASGRKVFERGDWSRRKPSERKRVLLKFAELTDACSGELALLDALEAGKPVKDCAAIDLPDTVDCIRWHAEACDKIYDHVSPSGPLHLGLIRREPVGVVGAVIPWNFPALMAAWKIGPALATGNSVVLKPAELTSLSALRLAELAAEAGLPAGVLNVVPGYGPEAGEPIGRHPDVDMVAFTGSTEVGRLFLQYSAASNLKRVILECGGKSPQVVMADASSLDAVAEHAVNAAFWNMGENCSCGSRLIVHESIKDDLVRKLTDRAATWKLGDPLDPATSVGSMIEKPHMDKVLQYIASGRAQGARVVMGGRRVREESGGYFVEVTVFDGVSNHMRIAREEIFGPVLSVITFQSEDEAIRLANDTNYGLAASLYTSDLNTAHRVAGAIRAGTVSVNCFSEGDITTPFGGYKQSGFAGRDKSIFAHEQYTELKTIWMQFG